MNADPKVTHEARCITARQDSGISNRKGEHSGVIIVDEAVMSEFEKERLLQQGVISEDGADSNFLPTLKDDNGIKYAGPIRRLMPKECFRLQGYRDEQFDKLVEIGIPESQLYKMAGNSVTTNVVKALGLKLINEIEKLEVQNA
jgi:DNA (cytosine-5)-methyltransferase 1